MSIDRNDPRSAQDTLIHFETRADKPRVFRVTSALISDALARNGLRVKTTLGEDLDPRSAQDTLIHFETRADKPRVFRVTSALISDALARNGLRVKTTLGED